MGYCSRGLFQDHCMLRGSQLEPLAAGAGTLAWRRARNQFSGDHTAQRSRGSPSPCARRAGSANRLTEENTPSVRTSWEIKCCAPIHKDRTQVIRRKIHPQVSNSTNLGNQFNAGYDLSTTLHC